MTDLSYLLSLELFCLIFRISHLNFVWNEFKRPPFLSHILSFLTALPFTLYINVYGSSLCLLFHYLFPGRLIRRFG